MKPLRKVRHAWRRWTQRHSNHRLRLAFRSNDMAGLIFLLPPGCRIIFATR